MFASKRRARIEFGDFASVVWKILLAVAAQTNIHKQKGAQLNNTVPQTQVESLWSAFL
jgi:hypothetical protein